MQRKHPPGTIQRFFKPVLAVDSVEHVVRGKGEAKKEADSILDDDDDKIDETENVDANAVSSSPSPSPSPPRPPATSSVAPRFSDSNNTTTRITTYSRRTKKKAKTATEGEEEEATMTAAAAATTTTSAIPTSATTTNNSARPPLPRPPPPPAKQRRLTQTHLDLGQASFTCSTCPRCGMVYAPGDPSDEKLHAAFHADALEGPRLPPSLTAPPSSSSAAGSSSSAPALIEVVSYPLSSSLSTTEGTFGGGGGGSSSSSSSSSSKKGNGKAAGPPPLLRGRVLHAPPGPRSLGCAAVRRALAVAEAALGSSPGWLLGIPVAGAGGGGRRRSKGGKGGSGRGGDDDDDDGDDEKGNGRAPPPASAASLAPLLAACGKHAFLFECADTRRAVGIAVVEPLASGTKLTVVRKGQGGEEEGAAAAATATASAAADAEKTTMTTTTTTTTTAGAAGAALGVRGVWVAPSHRRRGVATALIDAARARAVTYTVVGRRGLVVFSQPTEAGGGEALAGSYAGRADGSFLAYYV